MASETCPVHGCALQVAMRGEPVDKTDWFGKGEWVYVWQVSCVECEYEHTIRGREYATPPRTITEEEARVIAPDSVKQILGH